MKLDRNTNEGVGKYVVIKVKEMDDPQECGVITDPEFPMTSAWVKVPGKAVINGRDFFVLRYKDKFTYRALLAYAQAIEDEITIMLGEFSNTIKNRTGTPEVMAELRELFARMDSLTEYRDEILQEAVIAGQVGEKIPD